VIYFCAISTEVILLISAYAKNQKQTLSNEDKKSINRSEEMDEMKMAAPLNRTRYAELLAQALPRVIRNDKELELFTARLLALDERPRPSRKERELAELLTTLITEYEQKHHAIPAASLREVLDFLLSERGLSAKDLWPLVGSKGVTSEILNGKRGISVPIAGKLGAFFHLDPVVFIDWRQAKAS
jgi:HTH-type transcriptional regulator/antitoxin HigA